MSWPFEFSEKLTLGNMLSNVGVITLWTPRANVAELMSPDAYSVVGNFYDTYNGLEPFLRNCLGNPLIRYIVIVGEDKSGSKKVLTQLFGHGVDKDKCVVMGTDTKIPIEIPIEDIEMFVSSTTLIEATLDELNHVVSELPSLPAYAESRQYPHVEKTVSTFPSNGNVYTVRADYVGDAWLKILNQIVHYGYSSETSGKSSVYEIRNLVVTINGGGKENPDDPKMYPFYRFASDDLHRYYVEFCTDDVVSLSTTAYTYGSRLRSPRDQIQMIVDKLLTNKMSKSAYATTWRSDDILSDTPPCVISVHATISPTNSLNLTAYIRSNDMFRAWPLNAFGLLKIQKMLARELSCDIGDLTTMSHSAHVYSENMDDSKSILSEHYVNTNCFFDDRGYYVISLSAGCSPPSITMIHFSPKGEKLKMYTGETCRAITDELYSSVHPVDPYHISYISSELTKAELCILLDRKYVQDASMLDIFK